MCIRDRYKTEERLSGGIRRSVVVGQLSARSQQSSVGEKKANTKHNGATRRILGTTVLPGEYEAQRCYQANTGHNGAARRILGTTVLPGEYEAQRCYQADTKHNGATRRIRSTTVLPGEYEAQRCYQANTNHNGATRRIRSTTVLKNEDGVISTPFYCTSLQLFRHVYARRWVRRPPWNVSQRPVVVGGSGGGHDHRVGRYK